MQRIHCHASVRTFCPVIILSLMGLLPLHGVSANPATINLGTADSFAVLGGSGITVTGPTNVTGDIGTFPTPAITGLGSLTLTGTNHGNDAFTQIAKNDLLTAYNDAAGRAADVLYSGGFDLAGLTLSSGVYNDASSLFLSGTLTLDAQGDPGAVWIFQSGSSLITASASAVSLINGALACNVFWQVGSSATLGTNSDFAGTILALTSISLTTGATLDGRALAQNGAVTMDSNSLALPDCSADGGMAPVPEPATWFSLGTLAAAAALYARRQRKQGLSA